MADDSWDHPVLGRVALDDYLWRAGATLDAFRVFGYGWRSAQEQDTWTWLAFWGEERPTGAAVELAVRVVDNQASLVERVRSALWADFNGDGPRSGMWWHGELDEINEDGFHGVDDDSLIEAESDLHQHLGRARVAIRDSNNDEPPIAEITFSASFELEHGIGVLDDGTRVIGIGYASSARPFRTD